MKKPKKTEAPERKITNLDQIVTQLHAILRRETSDVVLAGNLLIKVRKLFANEHGEWKPWLAENFDMSYRTAINYINAAEYVERQKQKCNVALLNFENLSPTVLYRLAAADIYNEQEEAAILAATREGRVDTTRADAIAIATRAALMPLAPDPDDSDAVNDNEMAASEDPEITAILDGPPPELPPTPPNPPPIDFALQDFDKAISTLKRLMTKPSAQFAGTIHSANDLENIESFIHAVMKALKCPTQ